MDSRNRASPEQFLILLDFKDWMESGGLSRPQSGPQGRIKQDRLWQELIELLNSTGGGVVKSKEKWKKNQPSSFQNTTDRTQDRSSDILLEMLPRHSSQSIEEMASGSLTILPPPSGGNSNPAPVPATSPGQRRERAPSEAFAASPTASTPRRRALFARSRRIRTPFERSTSEFVNVENRRLKLEEDRERNLNRNKMLADFATALTTRLLPSSSSLPSTDILPSSSDQSGSSKIS